MQRPSGLNIKIYRPKRFQCFIKPFMNAAFAGCLCCRCLCAAVVVTYPISSFVAVLICNLRCGDPFVLLVGAGLHYHRNNQLSCGPSPYWVSIQYSCCCRSCGCCAAALHYIDDLLLAKVTHKFPCITLRHYGDSHEES